jgi:hypothetical protein
VKFTYDDRIDYWETQVKFQGSEITLRIDECYPEANLEQLGKQAIEKVDSNWNLIQDNIANSLLDTYNEAWADDEEGYPELSREEFLKRIDLETIELMDEGALTIYFSDAGLFGGHWIDLFWTEEKMYKATLAG